MKKAQITLAEFDFSEVARLIANEVIDRISNEESIKAGNQYDGELMTQRECADFLGVTVGTLIIWRKAGKIPYLKSGRTIFYIKDRVVKSMNLE